MREFFDNLLNEGKLCVHVEQEQADVNRESVTPSLGRLHDKNRILGWEFPIFRQIGVEASNQLLGCISDAMGKKEEGLSLLRDNTEFLQNAMQIVNGTVKPDYTGLTPDDRRHKERLATRGSELANKLLNCAQTPEATGRDWENLLTEVNNYYLDGIGARTVVHKSIGNKITENIRKYPDCTHLIA